MKWPNAAKAGKYVQSPFCCAPSQPGRVYRSPGQVIASEASIDAALGSMHIDAASPEGATVARNGALRRLAPSRWDSRITTPRIPGQRQCLSHCLALGFDSVAPCGAGCVCIQVVDAFDLSVEPLEEKIQKRLAATTI